MIEIETVAGPLDDAGLAAIGNLYGRIDAKYRRAAYLRHLFVENPFGWALHSFARDGDEVVGHCAVIPVRARVDDQVATSGKVEAYVVDERYRRSRARGDDRSVALDLLTTVSDAAGERGVDPLHAFLTPRVGAIFERAGYRAQITDNRPYVLATGRQHAHGERGVLAQAAILGQRAVGSLTAAAGTVRAQAPATRDDADLVEPASTEGSWTVAGNDSWEWFLASGFLSVLETRAGRALVLSEGDQEPVHLLAWRPNRAGLSSAITLLAALARFAKERSAPTLRVQPWSAIGDLDNVVRASRMMAFAPRAPFTIYARSAHADLPAVSPSPFFYATF